MVVSAVRKCLQFLHIFLYLLHPSTRSKFSHSFRISNTFFFFVRASNKNTFICYPPTFVEQIVFFMYDFFFKRSIFHYYCQLLKYYKNKKWSFFPLPLPSCKLYTVYFSVSHESPRWWWCIKLIRRHDKYSNVCTYCVHPHYTHTCMSIFFFNF